MYLFILLRRCYSVIHSILKFSYITRSFFFTYSCYHDDISVLFCGVLKLSLGFSLPYSQLYTKQISSMYFVSFRQDIQFFQLLYRYSFPCYFTYDDIAECPKDSSSYYIPSARSFGRTGPFPVHCQLRSSRRPPLLSQLAAHLAAHLHSLGLPSSLAGHNIVEPLVAPTVEVDDSSVVSLLFLLPVSLPSCERRFLALHHPDEALPQ